MFWKKIQGLHDPPPPRPKLSRSISLPSTQNQAPPLKSEKSSAPSPPTLDQSDHIDKQTEKQEEIQNDDVVEEPVKEQNEAESGQLIEEQVEKPTEKVVKKEIEETPPAKQKTVPARRWPPVRTKAIAPPRQWPPPRKEPLPPRKNKNQPVRRWPPILSAQEKASPATTKKPSLPTPSVEDPAPVPPPKITRSHSLPLSEPEEKSPPPPVEEHSATHSSKTSKSLSSEENATSKSTTTNSSSISASEENSIPPAKFSRSMSLISKKKVVAMVEKVNNSLSEEKVHKAPVISPKATNNVQHQSELDIAFANLKRRKAKRKTWMEKNSGRSSLSIPETKGKPKYSRTKTM